MTFPALKTPPNKPVVRAMERRKHQRVNINVLGRYMLPNEQEYPCQVINMSPGGLAMMAPQMGQIGDRVIAYLDHLGRVEGKIVRYVEGGFAMTINATLRKRDKMAAQLTWLANRHDLGLPEDRRHERITPRQPYNHLLLPNGQASPCEVLDVSLSGAAVKIAIRPPLGSSVVLGKTRAQVVRHIENGVALEFSRIQDPSRLKKEFM
jgi:hypothetical protein